MYYFLIQLIFLIHTFLIGGTFFYMNKILQLVKYAATSFASLLVQLFQMVLLKLGYEFKGTFSVVFLSPPKALPPQGKAQYSLFFSGFSLFICCGTVSLVKWLVSFLCFCLFVIFASCLLEVLISRLVVIMVWSFCVPLPSLPPPPRKLHAGMFKWRRYCIQNSAC